MKAACGEQLGGADPNIRTEDACSGGATGGFSQQLLSWSLPRAPRFHPYILESATGLLAVTRRNLGLLPTLKENIALPLNSSVILGSQVTGKVRQNGVK